MANLAKLEFVALDVSGNNYFSWVLDAELHLSANGLKDTIDPEKIPTVEQNDFKSVAEYNSALFKISSKLILYGKNITDAEMIEKTLSTFHPNTMILAQQYRERNFQKYGELISLLLMAEKNNELLLKNYRIRPTGSAQLPEVHNTSFLKNERGKEHRGERGYGRNRGRGNFRGRFRNHYHSGHLKWQCDGYNYGHHKWQYEVSN
ncbi:uncharacterized protein LOC141674274 [Apium graveolens]|uniref:uncharacterized protein LOC141674274 n=1 Tax=Apium graveolens TaxID=4045 RepID=UPI003D7B7031